MNRTTRGRISMICPHCNKAMTVHRIVNEIITIPDRVTDAKKYINDESERLLRMHTGRYDILTCCAKCSFAIREKN
jgi:hypothetical protein